MLLVIVWLLKVTTPIHTLLCYKNKVIATHIIIQLYKCISVNWAGMDGLLGVVTQTSTIKFAMAGIQEWRCQFPTLFVCRFYIARTY